MKYIIALLCLLSTGAYAQSNEEIIYRTMITKGNIERSFIQVVNSLNQMDRTPINVEKFKQAVKSIEGNLDKFISFKEDLIKSQSKSDVIDQIISEDYQEDDLKKMKSAVLNLIKLSDSTHSHQYSVYAEESFRPTNINVNEGDLLLIYSTGSWTTSPRFKMFDHTGQKCSDSTSYNILPNVNHGALLVRIRGSENPKGMGFSQDHFVIADASGTLEFSINDKEQNNNKGLLNLKIIQMSSEALSSFFDVFREDIK